MTAVNRLSRKVNVFFMLCVMQLTLVACCVNFAHADSYADHKITSEEQAVFAFFRAANVPPDFESWISSKLEYKVLPEQKKENFMIKEMLRLGRGYGMYDINTDLIEIEVNVIARYFEAEDDKPARITYRFRNVNEETTPTFNYRFADGVISMIIARLDYFSDIELNDDKNQAVREKIPYEDDEFDVTLQIHARVARADYEVPLMTNGIKQWIMLSEIAYIKCEVDSHFTQQSYILWDYVAPWHEDVFRIKNMPEEEKYPHPYDLFKD